MVDHELGATGKFPQGKLTDDDLGELNLAVTIFDEKVVVHFGKSVEWIGFDPDQAIQLATEILKMAGNIKGTVISVNIG